MILGFITQGEITLLQAYEILRQGEPEQSLYRHRILILFQHNYPSQRLCSRQLDIDIAYHLTPTTQVRRVFNQPT